MEGANFLFGTRISMATSSTEVWARIMSKRSSHHYANLSKLSRELNRVLASFHAARFPCRARLGKRCRMSIAVTVQETHWRLRAHLDASVFHRDLQEPDRRSTTAWL